MALLKLIALSGPLKGKSFKLRPGLRFGRTKGEIILDDNKVSSLHAYIKLQGKDLILFDNGSKNGIRSQGERVESLTLKLDTQFYIGTSLFSVVPEDIALDPGVVTAPRKTASSHPKAVELDLKNIPKRDVALNRPAGEPESKDEVLDFTKETTASGRQSPLLEDSSPVIEDFTSLSAERAQAPTESHPAAPIDRGVIDDSDTNPTAQVDVSPSEAVSGDEPQENSDLTTPVYSAEPEAAAKTEEFSAVAEEPPSQVSAPQVIAEPERPTPENPEPQSAVEGPKARKWNDFLAEFAEQIGAEIKDMPKAIVPLSPAVRLVFTGGIQAETIWTMGYGPRKIGVTSVDFPIFEPGAPEVCFEILPAPEGVTFRTNHPKEVKVNGQSVLVHPLSAGDKIVIGNTRIEVELIP